MYGIPTITMDYSIDPQIFDINDFKYRLDMSEEKNLYWLKKMIVSAYRKSGISGKLADAIAVRNASELIARSKTPGLAEAASLTSESQCLQPLI